MRKQRLAGGERQEGKREEREKESMGKKQTVKNARTNRYRQPYLRYCRVEELRRTSLERLPPIDPPIRNTGRMPYRAQDLRRGDKPAA
jgi:hypothetical protein